MRIKVKITGRQYDAAEALPDAMEVSDGASIELVLETIRATYGPISPGALLAVSGEHLGTVSDHRAKTLDDGDEVLIFSPVAGG
jgi:molybdopterin converting factor small subunit